MNAKVLTFALSVTFSKQSKYVPLWSGWFGLSSNGCTVYNHATK